MLTIDKAITKVQSAGKQLNDLKQLTRTDLAYMSDQDKIKFESDLDDMGKELYQIQRTLETLNSHMTDFIEHYVSFTKGKL